MGRTRHYQDKLSGRFEELARDNMPDGGQDLELPTTELAGEGRMPALVNAQPINAMPDNVGELTAMLIEATTDQEEARQEEA